MIRRFGPALFALALICVARASLAAPIVYTAALTGPGESPPNASPGTGTAEVDYDPAAHTLHIHVDFSGLLGTTTNSHLHTSTPSPLSGVAGVATTTPSFVGFPLGVTSVTFDNTLDMTLASSYNPAFVAANGGSIAASEAALASGIAAGKSYLNIHTTVVPAGEIRGFLVPVPEPASLVLMGSGILGLIAFGRRRASRKPA